MLLLLASFVLYTLKVFASTGPTIIINAKDILSGNCIVCFFYPPEVKEKHEASGEDSKNLTANFEIYLLKDNYRWDLASTERFENGKTKIEFTRKMRDHLDNAEDVICLGTSSKEVAILDERKAKELEEARAGCRAEKIASWVKDRLPPKVKVRKLNAGWWIPRSGDPGDTKYQRKIVIILVVKKTEGVNLGEAFADALKRHKDEHDIYQYILNRYSLSKEGDFNLPIIDDSNSNTDCNKFRELLDKYVPPEQRLGR